MKRFFKGTAGLFFLILIATQGVQGQETVYSVNDLYVNSAVKAGETVAVSGYYTHPGNPLLLEHYGDYLRDQAFPPQSTLLLKGDQPPDSAVFGGLVIARGVLQFEVYPDYKHPEDTLQATLQNATYEVLYAGEGPLMQGLPKQSGLQDQVQAECDSCKFAILISGGVNHRNNHSKYWENLAALYQHKLSAGYCKENIFVNYYHGADSARDNRIDASRIQPATKEAIKKSFDDMVKKFKRCKEKEQPITFQKMVTNHGSSNGDIDLLGNNVLKPSELREWQQMVIDSCASTIKEEFLQCYGGKVVDEMKKLDTRNKTTVYINSNADTVFGYSPPGQVHHYLKAKIDSLKKGKSYSEAVVAGKLAYDEYLKIILQTARNRLRWYRNNPDAPNRAARMAYFTEDSVVATYSICKSRNTVLTPMKRYCQMQEYFIPKGGSLELEFKGDNIHCGNVTVYKGTSYYRQQRAAVWNWNLPGSYRYKTGQNKRVINGHADSSSFIWVHNDNGQFQVTGTVKGTRVATESPSNPDEYAGFSVGYNDGWGWEFGNINAQYLQLANADQLGFELRNMPNAFGGTGGVQLLEVTFAIQQGDSFWTQMELVLDIPWVNNSDTLWVMCEAAQPSVIPVPIVNSGRYHIPLGDLSHVPNASMTISAEGGVAFYLDSWGLRSLFQPPVGVDAFGEYSVQPVHFQLSQNYPNPFNAETVIAYDLAVASEIRLVVYDLMGRQVAVLQEGPMDAGHHQITWQGKNALNQDAASGVYLIRLETDNYQASRKLLLLK